MSTPWLKDRSIKPEMKMEAVETPSSNDDKMITVPIPIRDGMTIMITVPRDLKQKESAKISRVMDALSDEPVPAQPPKLHSMT